MKLKFAPFCSSFDALSDGIIFFAFQNAWTIYMYMDYLIVYVTVHGFDEVSFSTHNSYALSLV